MVDFINVEGQVFIIMFEKDSRGNYTYLGMNYECAAELCKHNLNSF